MRGIALTQGKVALVDDEDYAWLTEWKWCAHWDGHNWYAIRSRGDPGTRKTISFKMHREILNVPKGMQTDHINGQGLDNRRSNLRICTQAQNVHNRGKLRNNVSGFKGVCWHTGGFWTAQIYLNNRRHHLGSFDDPIDAAKAYNEAALRLHGEFAKPNAIPIEAAV
jgi:hypothetical protein